MECFLVDVDLNQVKTAENYAVDITKVSYSVYCTR
jgi:hypothetical protein